MKMLKLSSQRVVAVDRLRKVVVYEGSNHSNLSGKFRRMDRLSLMGDGRFREMVALPVFKFIGILSRMFTDNKMVKNSSQYSFLEWKSEDHGNELLCNLTVKNASISSSGFTYENNLLSFLLFFSSSQFCLHSFSHTKPCAIPICHKMIWNLNP